MHSAVTLVFYLQYDLHHGKSTPRGTLIFKPESFRRPAQLNLRKVNG